MRHLLPGERSTHVRTGATRVPGRSVFDLSESVRPGDLSGAGGRGKTKTKNKGGPGAQGFQAAPRRGPKGESWGILGNLGESWEDHAWLTTCIEAQALLTEPA